MSKYRTALFLACLTLLTACGSAPVEPLRYYTLDDTSPIPSEPENPARIIVFKTLSLAEYLQQSYLAFQTNSHQLHYASQHIWAENLQTTIEKSLLKELNRNNSDILFIKESDPRAKRANEYLSVDIEHFLATNQKNVQLTARYWVNFKKEKVSKAAVSNIETPLQDSGYAASVKEMRNLITQFAQEIAQNINDWS